MGWIVIAAIIVVIILVFVIVSYYIGLPGTSRPEHDVNSDVAFYYPACYAWHPDFSYETFTIHGQLDEDYFLYRIIRRGRQLSYKRFLFSVNQKPHQVEIDNPIYGFSETHTWIGDTDKFNLTWKDNEIWILDNKLFEDTYLDMRQTRNKYTVGPDGFISADQGYVMASYIQPYIHTSGYFSRDKKKTFVSDSDTWIGHDWGQIDSGIYTHERWYIRLPENVSATIYCVKRNKTSVYHMTYQRANGLRFTVDDVVVINNDERGLSFESKKLHLIAELTPQYFSHQNSIGLYDIVISHFDEVGKTTVHGTVIYEKYIV